MNYVESGSDDGHLVANQKTLRKGDLLGQEVLRGDELRSRAVSMAIDYLSRVVLDRSKVDASTLTELAAKIYRFLNDGSV